MSTINLLSNITFMIPVMAALFYLVMLKQAHSTAIKYFQLGLLGIYVLACLWLYILADQTLIISAGNWPAPFGITLVYDRLTRMMLCVFSFVYFAISVYSTQDKDIEDHLPSFYLGSWLLFLGVIGAISTHDIFNLYVWSEVMLISAFILIKATRQNNTSQIYRYALYNVFGTLLVLLSIAFIYGITSHLNLANISSAEITNPALLTIAITLLLLGFAVKGAIFPLYFWLPTTYPNTSTSTTLILGSMITKAIMIVILRIVFMLNLGSQPIVQAIFLGLAAATMVMGVLGAASYHKIRNILSFHIISQIGYVLAAIFLPIQQAIIAAILFLIHNILIKSTLLITSGIIESRFGSGDLKKVGNIINTDPTLAILFFLACLSLSGIPPFSGFWGKFFIINAALNSHAYFVTATALIVSLFTLYSMTKIWRFGFCEASSSSATLDKLSCNHRELTSICLLLGLSILIGLFPTVMVTELNKIAADISTLTSLDFILRN